MALITVDQLAQFMGQPSLIGDPQATLAVALASAMVSEYLDNNDLNGVVEYVDKVFDGPSRGSAVFLVPTQNLVSVTKIETRSSGSQDWALWDVEDYRYNKAGFVTVSGNYYRADATDFRAWPTGIATIKMTYTAGFSEVPLSIVGVTLGLAARVLTNSNGLLGESIGDYTVQYGSAHSSWFQLDPQEMYLIDRYKERWVG
jgi:hypothetical protein